LTATGVAVMPLTGAARYLGKTITAQQIVDRVKTNVGVEWMPETVDTFKTGDPQTTVTGIVTASLASLEVLGAAVKAGANMIVTCEPTFFAKADSTTPPVGRLPGSPPASTAVPSLPDPVFTAKEDFIRKHSLVIWRFSDHWRLHKPNAFVQGLSSKLGWSKFVETADSTRFTLPETTLDAVVSQVKRSLNARGGMRIVGNPRLPVRRVALLPGITAIQASIQMLPEVDAIIAGEVREWESVEYMRDTVDIGGKKSLILVGRILSEGPGMQLCAEWLRKIVPEVTSTSFPVADPYWRPKA
jgi:putative NIF3 family GTP cyclohydrolase 1 type 2